MKRWRRSVIALGAIGLLAATGCPPPSGPVIEKPVGPPRALFEIVNTIESNARLLDQALSSNSISVAAHFTDRHGKRRTYNLEGSLLFQRPQNLRMDLRPGMGEQVMQIGSNADEYWLWIEPEVQTMWWGRYCHVGKPCAGTISVRPDQLVAIIGLGGLPRAGDGLIGPARKYGEEYDILYYLRERPVVGDGALPNDAVETGGRYLLEREYWIDRRPPYLVCGVQFRDEFGRVVTSAILDDYRPAWEGGPWVARKVQIDWPQNEGRFAMSVGGYRGVPPEKVSPRAFDRPAGERQPRGVVEVVQMDEECDEILPPREGPAAKAEVPEYSPPRLPVMPAPRSPPPGATPTPTGR